MINKDLLKYKVGGLLYMPAFQKNILNKIESQSIECLTSIAFCLEDSIRDDALEEAEQSLINILHELMTLSTTTIELPLIFIRVRSPEHLQSIHDKVSKFTDILTGYILPKFDLNNAENYAATVYEINRNKVNPIYIMPILETEMIATITTRNDTLVKIKRVLDIISDYTLNIRVGVNDLSSLYSLRRGINQTIYDIGIIRDILINILNVFAKDYVVAGSVYNFFGGETDAFKRELELDRTNGFIGKTAMCFHCLLERVNCELTHRLHLYNALKLLIRFYRRSHAAAKPHEQPGYDRYYKQDDKNIYNIELTLYLSVLIH